MRMIKSLFKNNRGESYVDVAITVMIVAFVLVFSVNIVSIVALNQNVKIMSDQIIDYATQNGTTDIGNYVNTLRENSGIDFTLIKCTICFSSFIMVITTCRKIYCIIQNPDRIAV